MTVITVSRQLGSGGDTIAEQVAEALGYEYIDRRLVEEIAAQTDTSTEEVEKYDEKGEGRIKHFLKRLLVPEVNPGGFPLSSAAYFPEFGLEFPYVMDRESEPAATYLDRGTYQLLITTVVQEYGQSGKAVIVGRASQVILAAHEQALHIGVVAPFERRRQTIMQARQMDEESAGNLCEQHDRYRELYLRNYHNIDWDDPLLYHLTLNTDKIAVEEAVDLIVHYAKNNTVTRFRF